MYKGKDFVTLRPNKFYEFLASMEAWETNDIKDKFTPERLLGVETNKGFITNVVEIGFYDIMKPSYYVYTNESLSKEDLYDVHSIKYYISDDSDEAVSFDEYIKFFYDIEGVLWKTV